MTAHPRNPHPDSLVRTIPPLPGERLDKHLANLCPEYSRASIQRMITEGSVQVNGQSSHPSYRLKSSDILEMHSPAETPQPIELHPMALNILYEDDSLLVIDKRAGVATHPGPGHESGTLANALLNYLPGLSDVGDPSRPGIVHRLDKDTSGLLVVAKTPDAHRDLSTQFKNRSVKKTYLALVDGVVSPSEGIIEAPIGRHLKRRKQMAVVQGGRESVTRYRTAQSFESYTLLEVSPETGRTHQIRVHVAAIGHPVYGDETYSKRDRSLKRHFLHAARLSFLHPVTRQEVEISSSLPGELSTFIASLERLGC